MGFLRFCLWIFLLIILNVPIIIGIVVVLKFYSQFIFPSSYILKVCKIILLSWFLSEGMAMSLRELCSFVLFIFCFFKRRSLIPSLLDCRLQSVYMAKSQSTVTLSPSSTGSGLCSYHSSAWEDYNAVISANVGIFLSYQVYI